MQRPKVQYHQATAVGRELEHVAAATAAGRIGAGGPFGARCAERLTSLLQAKKVLMTKSCTHGLEMMAHLLELEPGDEVILPSFAYVTTANAFALRAVRPVFADITKDTLNIDPASVRRRLSPRTKAIVALHYAGVGCAMAELQAIAQQHGLALVEDNAHGLGGAQAGRPLGSFGCLSALSFHETKTVTCGEGGALAINDPRLIERAEILLNKGTDRARFLRGQVASYSWQDLGSSYELSELHAAFLWGQLECFEAIQAQRIAQWQRYARELADWGTRNGIRMPVVPADSVSSCHIFALRLPTPSLRERFLAEMAECGVQSIFHFLPLHLSRMGQQLGGRPGDCPVAEDAGACLARLPLANGLSAAEQTQVIEAVRGFRC
jgi:dTDP-4-amino-4,6-dideoxygalactose transaminase